MNDPGSHAYAGGGNIDFGGGGSGNHNYKTRFYLAATKHFDFRSVGTLGAHIALIRGQAMSDVEYICPSSGVNFQFEMRSSDWLTRILNGLSLMAEVCPSHDKTLNHVTYDWNIGGLYHIWKDHINLIAELNDGKYFSGGIFFKVHLK